MTELDGLDQKGVCAHLIGPIDIPDLVRRGQDYDAQVVETRLLANPLQDLETVFAGHFQIQEEQTGHWIFLAIGIFALAFQVSDGFFPIGDNEERV